MLGVARWRLSRNGRLLEVEARRAGLRTDATLLSDAEAVGEGSGLAHVLLPLPCSSGTVSPHVLVLAPLPGVVARVVLLVPATDDESGEQADDAGTGGDARPDRTRAAFDLLRAERHLFDPPPGTLAARQRALEERHPRLWAARHVLLAVGRVVGALLGLAVLFQLMISPLLAWLVGLLSRIDWPDIPWPDVHLPAIPWPDLPYVGELPAWFVAVMDTTKYWVPVVVAVILAVREARRRSRRPDRPVTTAGSGGRHDGATVECGE